MNRLLDYIMIVILIPFGIVMLIAGGLDGGYDDENSWIG